MRWGAPEARAAERTKHLPIHVLLELGHPLPAQAIGLGDMHDAADGIHRRLVHEELQLGQLALAPSGIFVIQCSVTLAVRVGQSSEQ